MNWEMKKSNNTDKVMREIGKFVGLLLVNFAKLTNESQDYVFLKVFIK